MDGSQVLSLAKLATPRHIHWSINNNFPVPLPSPAYNVINRSIIFKFEIKGANQYISESLAACPESKTHLSMYFTIKVVLPTIL